MQGHGAWPRRPGGARRELRRRARPRRREPAAPRAAGHGGDGARAASDPRIVSIRSCRAASSSKAAVRSRRPMRPDGASQDGVVMGCGGQGASEREERIGAVAPADVQRPAAPTFRARRVGGAGQRVALARFGTGVDPVALDDRVDVGGFSSGVGQRVRMERARTTGRRRRRDRCGRRRLRPRRCPRSRGSPVRSTFIRPPIGMHVGDRPGVVGGGHDVERGDRGAGGPPRRARGAARAARGRPRGRGRSRRTSGCHRGRC